MEKGPRKDGPTGGLLVWLATAASGVTESRVSLLYPPYLNFCHRPHGFSRGLAAILADAAYGGMTAALLAMLQAAMWSANPAKLH